MSENLSLLSESKSYFQQYKEVLAIINKFKPRTSESNSGRELFTNPHFITFMKSFPGITGVIDLTTTDYVYMSDNIKSILGYQPEDFYVNGMQKVVSLFPIPHNEVLIQKVLPTMFGYFDNYSNTGNVLDLKASYSSLILHADGRQGYYLHQVSVIQTNKEGKPQFLLKVITDINEVKKDNSITLKISKKDEKGIYHHIFTQSFLIDNQEETLSGREIEVLNLIGQGKSSPEVADILSISENTVYKHRKNMLKKMDAKNTGELLSKAIAYGLI